MKSFVALVICGAMVLAGCQSSAAAEQTKRPAGFATVPDKILQLKVPQTLDPMYLEAAELFSGRVALLSGEKIYVEVVPASAESYVEVSTGSTAFALLPQSVMQGVSPEMACTALPFLYNHGEHIGAALNDVSILNTLRASAADAKLMPLLALSGDYPLLASGGMQRLSVFDFQNTMIALRKPDYVLQSALEVVGCESLFLGQAETLDTLFAVNSENIPQADLAEITMEQLLQWDNADAPLEVMWSMHRTNPLWLVTGTDLWDSLTPLERGIFQEAGAYLCGSVEEKLTRKRMAFMTEMERRGIVVQTILRQDFGNMLYELVDTDTPWNDRPTYFNLPLYRQIQACDP